MNNCKKCEGEAEGWKCEDCGDEAGQHDSGHACGGEKCQPKCKPCGEAENNCACGSSVVEKA